MGFMEELFISQKDLYMAISWLQASGIPTKMKEDVLSTLRGSSIYDIFGRNDNITDLRLSKLQIRESLSTSHFIPSCFVVGTGLFLSLIAFCVEKCRHKLRRDGKGPSKQERWAIRARDIIAYNI